MQTLETTSMGGQQAPLLSLAGGCARRAKSGLVVDCEGEGMAPETSQRGTSRPAEMTWLSWGWADQLGINASQEGAEGKPVVESL